MIGERAALVERFDADFVKQEIARKRAFILKCRMTKEDKVPSGKAEAELSRVSTTQTREVAIQSEKVLASSESSTSASETTSESSEHSEETKESEESAATSTEETSTSDSSASSSTSDSSSSSSRETVLRRNSATTVGKASSQKVNRSEESIESPPAALSPTSLYLKQLREKILNERMEKL
ncbi:hypothetical protein GCK32_008574 [Trichostrongylus colubriformis]|uniref:Uncharacterized protein n=1 Tax=Trichostrongylus colubriformis TaxID=6319 RepID=A0AAN8INI8_TRICO